VVAVFRDNPHVTPVDQLLPAFGFLESMGLVSDVVLGELPGVVSNTIMKMVPVL